MAVLHKQGSANESQYKQRRGWGGRDRQYKTSARNTYRSAGSRLMLHSDIQLNVDSLLMVCFLHRVVHICRSNGSSRVHPLQCWYVMSVVAPLIASHDVLKDKELMCIIAQAHTCRPESKPCETFHRFSLSASVSRGGPAEESESDIEPSTCQQSCGDVNHRSRQCIASATAFDRNNKHNMTVK